jgi:hypothetical protein
VWDWVHRAKKEPALKKSMLNTLFLGVIIALIVPTLALAQEDGFAFRFSNFSLEIFGGLSALNPGDFNKFIDYEEAWMNFFVAGPLNYLHALHGDGFTYTSHQTNDQMFLRLKRANPYGARIRYQASPTFALILGVELIDGIQKSNVGMAYEVTDRISTPGSTLLYTYQYRNPGLELRIKGWRPTFGAHFGWDLSKFLRSEIFINFGPLFTQTTAVTDRRLAYTEAGGYHWESGSRIEMKGTATALCGELGTTFMVRLTGFLQLYAEGSYSFREPGQMEGPGSSLLTYSDSLGAQSSESESWTGLWSLVASNIQRTWGRFAQLSLQNQIVFEVYSNSRRFALDLSGVQLKAGLKFNF